ncbi:MAG: N-acetylmuramoyl-L-alanine amidase [Defluviitaleaceae bacterium]|nr:N-acetylmuramoyl-L-alanine amidase [Defluviitaleaceae bacterium]
MKIFIDPGHGGEDPGAINEELGLKEACVNLDIALRLNNILISRGYETELSRTTNVFVALRRRAEFANDWDANYFVSIHSNSNENKEANGTETLVHSYPSIAYNLAIEVQRQLILRNGLLDRGIIIRPNLAVLRLTNMPAILIEVAFISNPKEAELLSEPEFRQSSAQAIADGITNYLAMNISE